MTLLVRYLILAGFVVVFALLARWTLRRLWRRGTSAWGRIVYESGVRRFGVTMWLVWTFANPFWTAWDEGRPLLSGTVLAQMIVNALVGVSLWLWAGYWWGRVLARVFGVLRPSDEKSEWCRSLAALGMTGGSLGTTGGSLGMIWANPPVRARPVDQGPAAAAGPPAGAAGASAAGRSCARR